MRNKFAGIRFGMAALAALVVAGLVASPAYASHGYWVQGVTCDPDNNTITITGEYGIAGSSQSELYVLVGGTRIATLDAPSDTTQGVTQIMTYSNPAFTDGELVTVWNPNWDEEIPGIVDSIASALCTKRINADSSQSGPLALYCKDDVLEVWGINFVTGEGTYLFSWSDWTGDTPAVNTLLKQSGIVTFWHLNTGEYQVSSFVPEGKNYAFIFTGCPYNGGGYTNNYDPNQE